MKKNNGTRVVVKALTVKGVESLALQKKEELEFRAKYKNTPKWRLSSDVRSYLKTVSAFITKDEKITEHHIMGFKLMSEGDKEQLRKGIASAFFKNGCKQKDFEVLFFDE